MSARGGTQSDGGLIGSVQFVAQLYYDSVLEPSPGHPDRGMMTDRRAPPPGPAVSGLKQRMDSEWQRLCVYQRNVATNPTQFPLSAAATE